MPIPCTPSSTVISDTLDGDTIVIDVQTGAYYTLTPAAGRLWEQAQTSGTCEPNGEADNGVLGALIAEGLLSATSAGTAPVAGSDASAAFTRYTDMEELLLADPIHDVDDQGWPALRAPGTPG